MAVPEVLVVGGVNHDLVVHADRRPPAGETVVGTGPVASAGGRGANIAVAAAAAGAEVWLCAAVGDDAVGNEQVRELQRSGVDTTHVDVVPGASTGVALIVVTDDGENSIVVGPRANAHLRADDVTAAGAAGNAVVVAQTEPGAAVIDAAAMPWTSSGCWAPRRGTIR